MIERGDLVKVSLREFWVNFKNMAVKTPIKTNQDWLLIVLECLHEHNIYQCYDLRNQKVVVIAE